MTQPLLRFSNASVGWGTRAVVAKASLDVAAGEIVGLVGPNGAGKSTLLKSVNGEAALLDGIVELDGVDLSSFTARDRARLVGVVPQQVTAAFSFPAVEFVEMGRHPHLPRFASPQDEDRAAVERAMRLTDTVHLAAQSVDALSGGDLQRLALAQALAQEPRLLLLDEPTSHLDLNHRLQVLDLVRDLVSGGLGALAVFHDLDLAARYADRIAVVSQGHLGAPGTPEQIITAEMLSSVFKVRAVVGTEPVTGSVSVTPVLREGAVSPVRRGSVLVVGGSGIAATLLRKLVLDGWEVRAGALNAGDADALVADALSIDYPLIPPFAPMDDVAETRVLELASASDVVIVCEVPFGNGNVGNLGAVLRSRTPLVLVGDITDRDYTGGLASALWTRARGGGALTVESQEQAVRTLARFELRGGEADARSAD